MHGTQHTQEVVNDMAGICRAIRGMFWTLRCSHQPCVRRCTSMHPHAYDDAFCTYARGSTATQVAVCQCAAMYGAVSRRTSTQDAADAKIIMLP